MYVGEKVNGLPHGEGKMQFKIGGEYVGQWKKGNMDGYGKLYYRNNKLAYIGYWRNNVFSGRGILYNNNPTKLKTHFDYKDFNKVNKNWYKYVGHFNNDQRDGFGVLYLTNKE